MCGIRSNRPQKGNLLRPNVRDSECLLRVIVDAKCPTYAQLAESACRPLA